MFHEVPQENELTVHSNTISVNILPQNMGPNEKRLQSSVVSSLKAEEEPVKHTHISHSLSLSLSLSPLSLPVCIIPQGVEN
jgi:hypothetical protein